MDGASRRVADAAGHGPRARDPASGPGPNRKVAENRSDYNEIGRNQVGSSPPDEAHFWRCPDTGRARPVYLGKLEHAWALRQTPPKSPNWAPDDPRTPPKKCAAHRGDAIPLGFVQFHCNRRDVLPFFGLARARRPGPGVRARPDGPGPARVRKDTGQTGRTSMILSLAQVGPCSFLH